LLSEAGADPLKLIVDRAQEVANADVAVIMLPISDHEFAVEASVGVREVDLKTFRIPFGRSLSGVAMAQNQPMLLADASADQRRVDSRAVEGLGPTMFVPFEGSRRGRGVLVLSRTQGREAFTESDLEMAANFANQATLAIQLAQGRSDQNRLGMLEDRSRIARDLHDHVVQRLFASGLGLQGVAATLEVPEIAGRILAHVSELDETIRQIRTTIFNLQEPGPEQRSVRGAVLDLAAQARKVLGFEPQVNFDGPVDTMVEGALADDVTAVVRESLSNIIRHSEASQVALRLSVTAEEVVLVIIDDGVGISDAAGQGGLSNLRQRADSRGGTFKLSHVVGGGTHVCWRVPLATE
ncbi:MAG TPA: GAF domain-containing protein, partial [Jatrophihabitantaceae bacterium]|nr:GAF domain-containing protein [Jatrophihabitantaceae bacterium]